MPAPSTRSVSLFARARIVVIGLVVAFGGTWAASAATTAAPRHPRAAEVRALSGNAGNRVLGAKSPTSRLAQTDRALLDIASATPVGIAVKLDYDSFATYDGSRRGFAATSPSATGQPLDLRAAPVRSYAKHTARVEATFLDALRRAVPEAEVGRRMRAVYGGVALRVPGNQVRRVLRLPGVVAVQRDAHREPLTDATPAFLGAGTIYDQVGGAPNGGRGTIVGVLDTGAWPEHPSFADTGTYPAPPVAPSGQPRPCNFGDNPLTPANDPFVCTNKLVGGGPFLDTYNAVFADEPFATSARDSDGHGTHTASTAAGGPVASAPVLGVERGPVHGVAPGAHVAIYKVCGTQACVSTDTVAAIGQAILDGVDVINFSISGGVDPFTDPVELAFLDAYAANVFVAAAAGNEGPAAGTANHAAPWITTVGASTQARAFESTLHLVSGSTTLDLVGASVTSGVDVATPVVLAAAAPYADPLCSTPAAAGTFTGALVVCVRGVNARVDKGFNVNAGGAAGMILVNAAETDVETDNHWLPTVHLSSAPGTALSDFLNTNPATVATFTAGTKTTAQGDVMASFSSRGPSGDWIKPDVTAPGVQILAGTTPTPNPALPELGPPGQYYMAIAGTSMSSPHVAGSAALIHALHPDWAPGQIKSALMTTASTAVVKDDGATPADPFDMGAGRVDLTRAGDPGLTFDESATNYAASALDPVNRVHLNTPSIDAPTMPGRIVTRRTVRNVSDVALRYQVLANTPEGTSIHVSPREFRLEPGAVGSVRIAINAPFAAPGQYFASVVFDQLNGPHDVHIPVAFVKQQGDVGVTVACAPTTIATDTEQSLCTTTATNESFADVPIALRTEARDGLEVTEVRGGQPIGTTGAAKEATLTAKVASQASITPATDGAFVPLSEFGVPADVIGDEEAINYEVPSFTYGGELHSTVGVVSNGYAVVGGAEVADISFAPQALPDVAPPNNELAPFWSDLDGTNTEGVRVAVLCDETNACWTVIEWQVQLFGGADIGDPATRVFQLWLGANGAEDVTFTYDPANRPAAPPAAYGLTIGAENVDGSGGAQVAASAPESDYRVTSIGGAPGGSTLMRVRVKGTVAGRASVVSTMTTPAVPGTTVSRAVVRVI